MGFGKDRTAVVADDHAIVRAALCDLLTNSDAMGGYDITVSSEAENGISAIASLHKHRPDLLLLDVSMPHAGGTEVLLEARRWSPDTKVIVFTAVEASGKIAELVEVGADGVFCKSDDLEELAAAIPRIIDGGRVICRRYMALLETAAEAEPLTDRERQVLNLVVTGKMNREIAEALGISIKTVDRHRTSVMRKTGVHSATELVAYALREGLLAQT